MKSKTEKRVEALRRMLVSYEGATKNMPTNIKVHFNDTLVKLPENLRKEFSSK